MNDKLQIFNIDLTCDTMLNYLENKRKTCKENVAYVYPVFLLQRFCPHRPT